MVACGAERNQILFRIVPRLAAKMIVVDFQARHRAARLTSPAIATQHLTAADSRTPPDLAPSALA